MNSSNTSSMSFSPITTITYGVHEIDGMLNVHAYMQSNGVTHDSCTHCGNNDCFKLQLYRCRCLDITMSAGMCVSVRNVGTSRVKHNIFFSLVHCPSAFPHFCGQSWVCMYSYIFIYIFIIIIFRKQCCFLLGVTTLLWDIMLGSNLVLKEKHVQELLYGTRQTGLDARHHQPGN